MVRNRREIDRENEVLFDERPPQVFYVEPQDGCDFSYDPIEEDDTPPRQHPRFISPFRVKRKVKDILCLVIFRLFLICWLIMIILGFTMGDLRKLQPPLDSDGRRCGVDIQVKDKPFLFLFDVSKYNNSIDIACTRECPQSTYIYKRNVSQDVKSAIPKLICKEGIDLQSVRNWNELDEYVKEAECAALYLESTPLYKRCIPTSIPAELQDRISNKSIEQLKKIIKTEIAKGSMLYYLFVEGIGEAKYILIGFPLMAAALSIIYVIAFRWLGKIFIISSVYILSVTLLFGIYLNAETFSSNNTRIFSLLVALALALSFAYFILSLYYARRRPIACEIIEHSCRAAGLSWSSLCIPIFAFFLCLLIVLLSTVAVAYLSTITNDVFKVRIFNDGCICPSNLNYTNGALCDPNTFMKECRTNTNGTCFESGCRIYKSIVPGYVTFMETVCWCGYWLIFMLVLFSRTVLAGAFAEYYWTPNKMYVPKFSLLKMMEIATWYHCGSLFIGSLSLALETFSDYRTRFTFGVMAIYGEGFKQSYISVLRFFRSTDNNHIYYLFDERLEFWMRVATFSIAGLTTAVAWLSCASFFEEDISARTNITGVSIFLMVIAAVSYLITYLTLEVLKIATVTVCICFMDDHALNADASGEICYSVSPEFLSTIRSKLEYIRLNVSIRH